MDQIGQAKTEQLAALVLLVEQQSYQVAVELGGCLDFAPMDQSAGEWSAKLELAKIDKFYAAGGKVDFLDLDGLGSRWPLLRAAILGLKPLAEWLADHQAAPWPQSPRLACPTCLGTAASAIGRRAICGMSPPMMGSRVKASKKSTCRVNAPWPP